MRPISRADHRTMLDALGIITRATPLAGRLYLMQRESMALVRVNASEEEWRWWTVHAGVHLVLHSHRAHVCGYQPSHDVRDLIEEEQADLLTGFLLLGDPEPVASLARMECVAQECGVPLHRVIAWNQRQELIW